jgi:hypothetical protein
MLGSNPELAVFTTYFGEARGTTRESQRIAPLLHLPTGTLMNFHF